jgi:hypothetical protein
MKNLIVFSIFLLISTSAFCQTKEPPAKWSQLPDMTGYDWSSEYAIATQNTSAVADDWLCENGLPINQVRWWGSYYQPTVVPYKDSNNWIDPTMPSNVPIPMILSFTIVIYDNAGPDTTYSWNHPGNALFTDSILINNANETLYGISTKPGGQQENVWQYDVSLNKPFYQELGEVYWLSITAVTNQPAGIPIIQWGWHQTDKLLYGFGADAVQEGYNPNLVWDLIPDTEMSFELRTIPEPSAFGMIGASLVVLGMFFRKRSE